MSEMFDGFLRRAQELRSAFDRSFATPIRDGANAALDLIAIRVGVEPFAIELSAIKGLYVDRGITPVPHSEPALLGIAGFRGAIVPVYSLRILFGTPGTQSPRWLVMAAAAPLAFAFEEFESHVRVSADAVVAQRTGGRPRGYAPAFIRVGEKVRHIVHLPSVAAGIGATGRPFAQPTQEQDA